MRNIIVFPPSSGGGGSGVETNYPEVATYADLPTASTVTGKIYIVRTTTGVIYINRKLAGIYRSSGSEWLYLGDVATYSLTDHNHNLADLTEKSYNSLTDKPSIPTKTSDITNDSGFITNSYHDSTKQDTLVSGTNIKTVGGQSLLGEGDISASAVSITTGTEYLVPKIIDSKQVYGKRINFGNLPSATTKDVAHGVTGITAFIAAYGVSTDGTYYYLLGDGNTSSYSRQLIPTTTNVRIITNQNVSAETAKITIEYTK
jgi:hypothetical protein